MSGEVPASRIEQLFELAVSSKLLLIGREALRRNKSHLHFVLIATDIIAKHRAEVLKDFIHYPVVQQFTRRILNGYSKSRARRRSALRNPTSPNPSTSN